MENILLEALKTSSIDFNINSDEKYQYELIANGEEKIVTRLRKYFEDCDEFVISVAFITMGGISLFLEELKNLENKGIKGKILTGDYLTFTEPKALKKLLILSMIFVFFIILLSKNVSLTFIFNF